MILLISSRIHELAEVIGTEFPESSCFALA